MNTSDTMKLSYQIAHLTPEVWAIVNKNLLKKAISEFAHELLLELELIGQKDVYRYS